MSGLVFVPVFLLNLMHLRARKIPLYSWGTVIAAVHICAGVLSFILIPVAAILVSITVEIVNALMNEEELEALHHQYDAEIQASAQQIQAAQQSYEQLFCLNSYTVEQEFIYRKALSDLEANGIWYYVRNGLITSILIKPEDAERAQEVLGLGRVEPAEERDVHGG